MLRRRTPDDELVVKMWAFPVLTVVAILGILAILVQMLLTDDTRSQLLLSLLSWAVALVLYVVNRRVGGAAQAERSDAEAPSTR